MSRSPTNPVPPQPSAPPPWRAQLDELAAVLAEAGAAHAAPSRLKAEVAAVLVREAGDALPPARVERLAERLATRVARVLAA
jgi:hypothetical protein